jgi:transposase
MAFADMNSMRPKGNAAELERRRRRAVQLLSAGESPTDIARFLGCSRASVYRWQEAARAGPEGLSAKPHPGRPPELTDKQILELERLLLQGPTAHGWHTCLWTGSRVARLIQRHFGVTYCDDHALRVVRWRLGWSCQKPERRARERDEAEIARWKREEWPRIKKLPA